MRKIEERDEFIRTSIGSQVRSSIKKFCFYIGNRAVKVQMWMTYDLGVASPFEDMMSYVKDLNFTPGTIYRFLGKNESNSLQITVLAIKGQLSDEEKVVVRHTIEEMVLDVLHKADSQFEKRKWDYYGKCVDTMERMLFRTIVLCGASFIAGCIAGASFGMDWVNTIIRTIIMGAGLGLTLHLATKDFYMVRDLKCEYQVGIES